MKILEIEIFYIIEKVILVTYLKEKMICLNVVDDRIRKSIAN